MVSKFNSLEIFSTYFSAKLEKVIFNPLKLFLDALIRLERKQN